MSIGKVFYKSFTWRLVQFASSGILNIYLAHQLGAELSGQFYGLSYLLVTAANFLSLGFDVSLNYYVSRRELPVRGTIPLICLIAGLALVVSLTAGWYFFRENPYPYFSYSRLLWYAALMVAGNLLVTLCGSVLTAGERNHVVSQLSALNNLAVLLVSGLLLRKFPATKAADTIFLAYFLAAFLQGALMLAMLARWPRRDSPGPGKEPGRLPRMLSYAGSVYVTNFLFFAGRKLPVLLIPYWVSAQAVGNYIQAYKMVDYLAAFASILYFPVVAMTAGKSGDQARRRILLLVRISNTALVLGGGLLAVTGRFLFPWILGDTFRQVHGIFLILLPGMLAAGSSPFLTAYFFGSGNLRINLTSAIIMMLGLLVTIWPLQQTWGIWGVAGSFSLSGMASFLYDIWMLRRLETFRWSEMLVLGRKDLAGLGSFFRNHFFP